MTPDFEKYLYEEVHPQVYDGLDDEMPDHFADWVSGLSVDELIAYANRYVRFVMDKGTK